jgi:hypothetical protein
MSDDKQFDADIDVNAGYAMAMSDHAVIPARPCPSPGMLQVGRIEFSPNTPESTRHLTNRVVDGKVGLFVPIPDLTKAARMLEGFAEVVKLLGARTSSVGVTMMSGETFTVDELLRVAKSLKGQR